MNSTPSRLLVPVGEYELVVDVLTREVIWRDSPIRVRGKPYLMLEILALRAPDSVSYYEIYQYIYEPTEDERAMNMRILYTILNRLRKILSQHQCEDAISTHYGYGLRIGNR